MVSDFVHKAARIVAIMFSPDCMSAPRNRLWWRAILPLTISLHTLCKAIRNDLRKFVRWFTHANGEDFIVNRVTAAGRDRLPQLFASRSTAGGGQRESSPRFNPAIFQLAGRTRQLCHRTRLEE